MMSTRVVTDVDDVDAGGPRRGWLSLAVVVGGVGGGRSAAASAGRSSGVESLDELLKVVQRLDNKQATDETASKNKKNSVIPAASEDAQQGRKSGTLDHLTIISDWTTSSTTLRNALDAHFL